MAISAVFTGIGAADQLTSVELELHVKLAVLGVKLCLAPVSWIWRFWNVAVGRRNVSILLVRYSTLDPVSIRGLEGARNRPACTSPRLPQ